MERPQVCLMETNTSHPRRVAQRDLIMRPTLGTIYIDGALTYVLPSVSLQLAFSYQLCLHSLKSVLQVAQMECEERGLLGSVSWRIWLRLAADDLGVIIDVPIIALNPTDTSRAASFTKLSHSI